MKQKLYAAYGSNLHLADMRQRCPQAVRVGHALLHTVDVVLQCLAHGRIGYLKILYAILYLFYPISGIGMSRFMWRCCLSRRPTVLSARLHPALAGRWWRRNPLRIGTSAD